MKKEAIPEEEEEASQADECSVDDIIDGSILKQNEELKEDEKVAKSTGSKDESMVLEPAFPTSLNRAQAGIVAGPGAIAIHGADGGVANQAPPLTAEQSTFLAEAELVPDSPDVEQGNSTVSDSKIVNAQVMNKIEPNFWDLLKLKSVRIALLVLLVVVIALAVGMGVGFSSSNGSQTTVFVEDGEASQTPVSVEDDASSDKEVEVEYDSENDRY